MSMKWIDLNVKIINNQQLKIKFLFVLQHLDLVEIKWLENNFLQINKKISTLMITVVMTFEITVILRINRGKKQILKLSLPNTKLLLLGMLVSLIQDKLCADKLIRLQQTHDLNKNFDIIEDNGYDDYYIVIQQSEMIKRLYQFYRQAIKLIKEANVDRDDLSDFFNAITQFAKNLLYDTIKKFEMEILFNIDSLGEIEQLKAFQIALDLKLEIQKMYENIIQHALKKANRTQNYFVNYIRKCYHKEYGQVWILNRICGETTICGQLIDSKTK